ncbi:hypothetical protein OPV22_028731 [Ensete ventricosum]|uniref:Uncharacterized protein n=1 Tax=Ensete ventricosum TaxID=4639 RepID=A0AAV8QBF2_ENSVE|nr:hypothetical protein OPV22_028731 [Ensete ventricosum]
MALRLVDDVGDSLQLSRRRSIIYCCCSWWTPPTIWTSNPLNSASNAPPCSMKNTIPRAYHWNWIFHMLYL